MKYKKQLNICIFCLLALAVQPLPQLLGQVQNNPNTVSQTKQSSIDFTKLVSSLTNSYPPPVIANGWNVDFPSQYNFEEQRRILKDIYALQLYAEEAWDPLCNNLGNSNYSITIQLGGGARNLTVADVCEQIISNTLYAFQDEYVGFLKDSGLRLIDLREPGISGREPLHKWLKEQAGVPLVDLQIELSEKLSKRVASLALPAGKRESLKLLIEEQIRYLKERRYPQIPKHFIPTAEFSWYLHRADTQ